MSREGEKHDCLVNPCGFPAPLPLPCSPLRALSFAPPSMPSPLLPSPYPLLLLPLPLPSSSRGLSSTVRKCISRDTGQEYAVKIIDKSQDEAITESIMIEKRVLGSLPQHKHISECQYLFVKHLYQSTMWISVW